MNKSINNVNLVIIWELIGTIDTQPYTPENVAYWIWVGIARTLRPYAPTHCLPLATEPYEETNVQRRVAWAPRGLRITKEPGSITEV